jgi:hypothetical protein
MVMIRAPSSPAGLMPPMLPLPMELLAGRIQTGPRPQLRHEADPTMGN